MVSTYVQKYPTSVHPLRIGSYIIVELHIVLLLDVTATLREVFGTSSLELRVS